MTEQGVPSDSFIGFSLEYDNPKKVTVKGAKEYLATLMPVLKDLGVKYLYCTDGNYFKVLTKARKAEPNYGYVLPCTMEGYEHMHVVLSANYQGLFINDTLQEKIDLANKTLVEHRKGTYQEIGTNIIKHAEYIPANPTRVKEALDRLHQYDSITIDTETFSLLHTRAGLGTIGFAWSEHEGICIDVEHYAKTEGIGLLRYRREIKELLRKFLTEYRGNIKFHNASYDIKILIYYLWMDDMLDTEGLLTGLDILTRDFDDTRIIAYLALNSCGQQSGYLSLKNLAHEFAGNYAQDDIDDITLIKNAPLMEYNLVDCLSTWFVFKKYYPVMVQDEQLEVYQFFKKILKNIIQMELTGMPLNMTRVLEVQAELQGIVDKYREVLKKSKLMAKFSLTARKELMAKKQAKLKKKVLTLDDIDYEFNTNSNLQLISLLHEFLGFEVHSTTDSGQPAVGGDELKGHMKRTDDPEIQEVLEAIIKIQEGDKILGTFINKFVEAEKGPDGWHYLFGSFNLGGTKSGRLSSSKPNLQNLPSGSTYGKLVKSCFQAAPGWLFVGLDYASLEDRINTLLTKDPNKIKVYTSGFDGHSLRAYSYFGESMPDIEDTVESINSISDKYPQYRQDSKAPTFALTYQGTWATLVANCGFTKTVAKQIEARYHELYKVSDSWVQQKLAQASEDGYVTLAFGLRLRTPILAKTILGNSYTPKQAAAESRTAGNAVSGQSYGLLNSRAGVEFQERTMNSKHRLDIKPSAHIHDAQYMMIRNRVDVVEWVNDNLVECVEWQELPEIQHDEVKLTGNLGIFYPAWHNEIELKHQLSAKEIVETCKAGIAKYEAKKNG
ncbi:DNA polymerase [Vibrio phage pVco-5]|uniref:DNA polymerase n=1 Tax=Vibrio phage pVco-5 TaxID=1965485 RepID=A0A1W6JUY2_9CAUD|nr:DNA polymerase [Vibrio phage pVco-5]ARM71084.1 DNA polymerase [Vibrio phage pVco-5]